MICAPCFGWYICIDQAYSDVIVDGQAVEHYKTLRDHQQRIWIKLDKINYFFSHSQVQQSILLMVSIPETKKSEQV